MDSERDLRSSRSKPESITSVVKSVAEVTSAHTVNISDDVLHEREQIGIMTVTQKTLNKGTKRCWDAEIPMNKEGIPCIHHLHESVPEVIHSFDILSKIGEGTFSSVYLACAKDRPSSKVALKHLIPTSSATRIENEIRCLKTMGGRDNVIELKACLRHKDHVVLIMPYFPHDKFTDYLPYVSVGEVQLYMKSLFQALSNVHSHHVIHRDIKPSNFLYHRETRRFQLIDFGLAQLETAASTRLAESKSKKSLETEKCEFIHSETYKRPVSKRVATRKTTSRGGKERMKKETFHQPDSNFCPSSHLADEVCGVCMGRKQQPAPRAGTPGFRAPEVLLKCPNQTTGVDIWSAGVILLCLLSGHYPFFRAHDDQSAMAQIIGLFGSRECSATTRSYGKALICEPEVSPVDLKHLCKKLRTSLFTTENQSSPVKKKRIYNGVTDTIGDTSPDQINNSRKNGCLNSSNSSSKYGFSVSDETSMETWENPPDSVYDLLLQCLDLNPVSRITAHQALTHPFFTVWNFK